MALFRKSAEEEEEEELEQILFQGAVNGKDANLAKNAKLARAGLVPAKELLTDALLRHSEMLRLEPKGERTIITFFVDGVPYPGGRMPGKRANAITQMIKLLSGLDVAERRRPQDGGIKTEYEDVKYVLDVASRPVKTGGESLTVKVTNVKEDVNTPDELGFPDAMKAKIKSWGGGRSGFILTVGPPMSGLTKTALGVLRCIDAYVHSMYTVCEHGAPDVMNVSDFEIEEGTTVGDTILRVVRAEGDVIWLDPLKTEDQAKTIVEYMDQITMVTEMAGKDAASGIGQLYQLFGDPGVVAKGLKGIVSHKLIRKICPKCREAYRPNPKLLKQVGLPPETKVLYRKPRERVDENGEDLPPCRRCGDIGFVGRTGIFEYIEVSDEMRALIAQGAGPMDLKAQAKKEEMLSLQKDSLRLIAKGMTSLEELQRVFKPAGEGGKKKRKKKRMRRRPE
ncbi:MAG: secretion system protein E [Planctomycetaceae bacterium]|nr:secretion system protein E [Planctomycetaceae bacterium]